MSDLWLSITPLIIAGLTIASGFFAYGFNKRIDRKHSLIELRRGAYRDYLRAFYAMIDNRAGNNDVIEDHLRLKSELLLIGSDSVVQSVGALSKYTSSTNGMPRDLVTLKDLVANLIIAMRADCFAKSKLELEEIRSLVPIV